MKRRKNKIPYAIANFERLRGDGCYFVDKTKYIETLEEYVAPVFLRPRRFGKTLWCSILECYYDLSRADRFNDLFEGTYIAENSTSERSSLFVIRFNFSVVLVSDSGETIQQSFNSICKGVFSIFLAQYASYFEGFDREYINASDQLEKIIDYIKEHNLPKLYIIIDEYDNFTNQLITTHQHGLYNDLTTGDSFFRTFFKTIKAGIENLSIRHVYITGVLPVTIDDLTSGFNVAQIITLKKPFLGMVGFTQEEVDLYLDWIKEDYSFEKELMDSVRVLIKNYYNGYHFAAGAASIYNSTIFSYFMFDLIVNEGELEQIFIDSNLKTDIRWIRTLTVQESNTKEMLEEIMLTGELAYDSNMASDAFNLNTFYEKEFYPVSLFYLGMLTFKDAYSMVVPNQTMRTIFTEYYNRVEKYNVSTGYTEYFRQFERDTDLSKLFAGYWEKYVGQIPAQAFDKMNENFFRTTFYELCRRHLSHEFIFNIEVNYPCGRSDWELLGKPHTEYKNLKYVAEFKHFSVAEAKRKNIMELEQPFEDDVLQVTKYADEILKDFPYYTVTRFVIYTVSCSSYRFFQLS